MPWKYNITNNSTPPTPNTYQFSQLNTLNQESGDLSIPGSSAVTKLAVYSAGKDSSTSARLILWSYTSTRSVLAQSATFTMAMGSLSIGGQFWYQRTLSTPYAISSTNTYWIGLYRDPLKSHYGGGHDGSTGYRKTNKTSSPVSMSGAQSRDKELLIGVFYITAPSAPTSCSVARVNDTKHIITWTNHSSTDQPYTKIVLERKDNDIGSWYVKNTFTSSTIASYTDYSTIANRTYQYRVRAWNAAGYSSYSTSSEIDTTPAPVTITSAERVGGSIVINWTNTASNNDLVHIEKNESLDEGATWEGWVAITPDLAADAATYTDTSPYAYGKYQIRTEITSPALASAWAETEDLITVTAPNPPTNLLPDLLAFDGTEIYLFKWNHNPADGTAQTKFSLQYKVSGGAYPGTPQIDGEVSSNEYTEFAGGTFTNGNTYKWQVKTWGEHVDSSGWSDEGTFYAFSKPEATITVPSGLSTHGQSSLTVAYVYTQSEAEEQNQYICELYDDSDNVLETKADSSAIENGSSISIEFDTVLADNTTYNIVLKVKAVNGIWSEEETVEFTTSFLTPIAPLVELALDEVVGGIDITITNTSVVSEYNVDLLQDTYTVADGGTSDDTNYNDDGTLVVRGDSAPDNAVAYLEFDLTDIIGKTITDATLNLKRETALVVGVESCVKYVKTSWDETTLTANTAPTLDSTEYDDHAHTEGDFEAWDITSLISAIADGSITDYEGLAIVATTTDGSEDSLYDSTEAGYEPSLIITIEPENVDATSNNVYRSIDDGDYVLVKDGVPTNTTITDYTPTIYGNNKYIVTGISATPTSKQSDVAELDVDLVGVFFLNSGAYFAEYVKLYGDISFGEDYNIDSVVQAFEGRTYPVEYKGILQEQVINFGCDLPYDKVDALKSIIVNSEPTFYRDFKGRYFACNLSRCKFAKKDNAAYQFTCTITRVEHE